MVLWTVFYQIHCLMGPVRLGFLNIIFLLLVNWVSPLHLQHLPFCNLFPKPFPTNILILYIVVTQKTLKLLVTIRILEENFFLKPSEKIVLVSVSYLLGLWKMKCLLFLDTQYIFFLVPLLWFYYSKPFLLTQLQLASTRPHTNLQSSINS